jgi:glycogen operon protein
LLRQNRFMTGDKDDIDNLRDVTWLTPGGEEVSQPEWDDPQFRVFAMRLDERRQTREDNRPRESLIILLNSGDQPASFAVKRCTCETNCEVLVDTARVDEGAPIQMADATLTYETEPRSLVMLRLLRSPSPGE